MNDFPVAIIGGGISGLHTAYKLALAGQDFVLLEAKPNLGGRIFCHDSNEATFDLGPSWFWPGQNHIQQLIKELGLSSKVFEQYAHGDATYEPLAGNIQRGVSGISMQGAYRLEGGLRTIIRALHDKIDSLTADSRIRCSAPVHSVTRLADGVEINFGAQQSLTADRVIMAAPARVLQHFVEFKPSLSPQRQKSLEAVATWMAGHGKIVVTYEHTFWREDGLSGDVISQQGPLSEIHDASSKNGEQPALFGFLLAPPKHRAEELKLRADIVEQLGRLFGEAATTPNQIIIKDWSTDVYVATSLDQHMPNHHPVNQWASRSDWQRRIIWSGSESAEGHFNGYIEGALIASEQTLLELTQ